MHNKFKHNIIITIILVMCIILNTNIVKAQESTDNLIAPLKLKIAKTDNYYVTIEDVLRAAEQNNIPLLIEKENTHIDKLSVIEAYSELLPSVIGSYEQSRFQGGFQIFGNQSFLFARTTIAPRLSLDYSLNGGGEQIYKILAAKRQLNVTKYGVNQTTKTLLLDTTNAYLELLKAIKRLEIANKEIEAAEETLNLNKRRLEVGLGTILEVSQSEEQLANSKKSFITANKNILKSSQALNRILNIPVEVNLIPLETEFKPVTLVDKLEMEPLLNIALSERDDLKLIKEKKALFMAQRGIARAKFFPTAHLSMYWGGQGPRFSDLEEQRQIGYRVELDFLKNLGVNYLANYKKSGPLIKQEELKLQQKIRDIETELANALLEAEASERQIDISQTSLNAANNSFTYATERLKAGVGSNIDVVTSLASLTRARTDLVESIIDYNKSQVGLLHSIGLISIDNIISKTPVSSSYPENLNTSDSENRSSQEDTIPPQQEEK